MKIALLTLGCRTNQAENLKLEHNLQNLGHQIVDLNDYPDVCIINTCAVTVKADCQSRQLINKALKMNIKVIATGCYSELNNAKLSNSEGDLLVMRNYDKDNIINMFTKNIHADDKIPQHSFKHRPIVKVQDGCNYSCSYCTIPMARGSSRSLPLKEILHEIQRYESLGHNEIVLTGIHLGTYGVDLKDKRSLSGLLKDILRETKIRRIRLSSLEIREIDDELIELLNDRRLCKHLHIPLQSGDNSILKLMNRTYSIEEYASGIHKILKRIPDISIGTDVIVGFPGEGESEFSNTKSFIEALPFSYLHVFPYSSRPGTRAIKLPKHIPDPIKKMRVSALRETGDAKKRAYIDRNIGKNLDIIIEEQCSGGYLGTTGNYIKVLVETESDMKVGMLVNIGILEIRNAMTVGILINS
ncbi:MAG: tRNA (N(6)-L-threonylcarbamoyladenosine(37)-C(2))-methylthiotransferase MtaB [Nitrospirae bacterium]|nr:tRNA (N(6)-L-threonylcarbamoyladenosine(37)-C(2))-methylthiotransferase MtaB [Nitrospirota bacterium]MCL5238351.1 tRNA (N(6)-L-threonylcarbamoyladenosine(37)-C(2))-methylthiotransferase MtaB [Nitrospirota bacterium]